MKKRMKYRAKAHIASKIGGSNIFQMGIKISIFDVQFFYEDLRGLKAYYFHLGRVLRMLKYHERFFLGSGSHHGKDFNS